MIVEMVVEMRNDSRNGSRLNYGNNHTTCITFK